MRTDNATPGSLVVVSAPSGCGKTTLLRAACAADPRLVPSLSTTTRRPRGAEVDGRDYRFVTRGAFVATVDAGGFLEWAEVHGNLYGTDRRFVENATERGLCVALALDVQGAAAVRAAWDGGVVSVFLLPPSGAELASRLRGRGEDDEDAVAVRLANARVELGRWRDYDHVLVNRDVGAATRDALSVVSGLRRGDARRVGLGHAEAEELVASIDADLCGMLDGPSPRPWG